MVEPRRVGRGENQFEATRLAGKEALGLARAMGGVIVEQQADQHTRRVIRIEPLKEGSELARAMPLRDHMMHVVLAHHRLKEWGSPVTFACPEAAFVHYVDNLHGDVFGIIQKREEAKEESISYGFGDQGTKILKESFNETLEKMKGVEGGF